LKIAIIGGGLAGTSLAYFLRHGGYEPVIYEAGPTLAAGASGNRMGLYNPRFSAQLTPEAVYYKSAFDLALSVFPKLGNIGWNPCGAIHLITDEKKEKRFAEILKNWNWSELSFLTASQASEISGLNIKHDGLYLPHSGVVSPRKLCAAMADGVDVRLNSPVDYFGDIEADIFIVASGTGSAKLIGKNSLPLQSVRGQITDVRHKNETQRLKCAICYSGYLTPSVDGLHTVGSTFQRWLDHSDVLPQDDTDNIEKLAAVLPEFAEGLSIVGQRASVRTSSRDQFPVVGHLRGNIYISTAHGSHGILSSLMAAQILVAMIKGDELPVPQDVIQKLDPARF
jgi:tRNA 5-methylaminomethyl-2-thiouridine biosynthesis bifunctional protein